MQTNRMTTTVLPNARRDGHRSETLGINKTVEKNGAERHVDGRKLRRGTVHKKQVDGTRRHANGFHHGIQKLESKIQVMDFDWFSRRITGRCLLCFH